MKASFPLLFLVIILSITILHGSTESKEIISDEQWKFFEKQIDKNKNWTKIRSPFDADKILLKQYLKENDYQITEYEILHDKFDLEFWLKNNKTFLMKPKDGRGGMDIRAFEQEEEENGRWKIYKMFRVFFDDSKYYYSSTDELLTFLNRQKQFNYYILEELIPFDFHGEPFEVRCNVFLGETIVMWVDETDDNFLSSKREKCSQIWRFDKYEYVTKEVKTHLRQLPEPIDFEKILYLNRKIFTDLEIIEGRVDYFIHQKNGKNQYVINEVQGFGMNLIEMKDVRDIFDMEDPFYWSKIF